MSYVKWQEGKVEPRTVFWGSRAVPKSVVYLRKEGGAEISNRET